MTCRGYDSKAVKIGKEIKRIAATILDRDLRRDLIRSYVQVEIATAYTKSTQNRGEKNATGTTV